MPDSLTLRAPAPTAGFLNAYTQSLFGGMRERRLQEASDLQSLVREAQLAKIRREQEAQEVQSPLRERQQWIGLLPPLEFGH